MPRLYRPPIPIEVKLRVLLRQRGEMFVDEVVERAKKLRNMSSLVAFHMAGLAQELGLTTTRDLRLDHDPALGLRKKWGTGRYIGHGKNRIEVVVYTPKANDPEHLLYRTNHGHHIKTNVRGDGAQFSDTALMKRERRRVKKKSGRKRKWPLLATSKQLVSASRWATGRKFPKGQKLRSRSWPRAR